MDEFNNNQFAVIHDILEEHDESLNDLSAIVTQRLSSIVNYLLKMEERVDELEDRQELESQRVDELEDRQELESQRVDELEDRVEKLVHAVVENVTELQGKFKFKSFKKLKKKRDFCHSTSNWL